MSNAKPCDACPWIKKGQPDIGERERDALSAGEWFCCHTRLDTCIGAVNQHKANLNKRGKRK